MDLNYKFVKDFNINSLSAKSNADVNSKDVFNMYLKEKNIIWEKLRDDKKIELLNEYKCNVIVPKIYKYLKKCIKNIIINYKKEIEGEIYISDFDNRYISMCFQENDYKKRLKELVDSLEYMSLRKDEKEFIYLMYNDGDIRKVKEIAEILKISVQAVHKRITRITKHYQEINQQ